MQKLGQRIYGKGGQLNGAILCVCHCVTTLSRIYIAYRNITRIVKVGCAPETFKFLISATLVLQVVNKIDNSVGLMIRRRHIDL